MMFGDDEVEVYLNTHLCGEHDFLPASVHLWAPPCSLVGGGSLLQQIKDGIHVTERLHAALPGGEGGCFGGFPLSVYDGMVDHHVVRSGGQLTSV